MRDRCIHCEGAGDQVVGRTVAGLDVCSHEFAISPPHFVTGLKEDESSVEEHAGVDECIAESSLLEEHEVDECISTVFPSVPDNWRLLARYLLASLLFARD